MKVIKKINLFEMEKELNVLDKRQRNGIVAGNGPQPGYGGTNNCFFDCIAYLAGEFGNNSYLPDQYSYDFYKGNLHNNDDWEGTKVPGDYLYGPKMDASGMDDMYNYFNNYFETASDDWHTTASGISSLFDDTDPSDGYKILASITLDSTSDAHAVILQSYTPPTEEGGSDGYYTYYDPSNGSSSTVNEADVLMAGAATGFKDWD